MTAMLCGLLCRLYDAYRQILYVKLASKPLQYIQPPLPVDAYCRSFVACLDVAGRPSATGLVGVRLAATLPGDGQRVGISRGAAAAICAFSGRHPLANARRCGLAAAAEMPLIDFAVQNHAADFQCRHTVWRLRTFSATLFGIKEK